MFYNKSISIHAPLAGCDAGRTPVPRRCHHFNPRTPCGVRPGRRAKKNCVSHFNPRTPCGVRHAVRLLRQRQQQFQSTHPLRGATWAYQQNLRSLCHFNPRTPCGVRLQNIRNAASATFISIHAPLAGCDRCPCELGGNDYDFNPRPPCGVRRRLSSRSRRRLLFQSTHPLRGATLELTLPCYAHYISIHAPLAGCDAARKSCGSRRIISIHAPLAGCDSPLYNYEDTYRDFNPRTPCGVRPASVVSWASITTFQSTHPLRGATPRI